MTSCAECLAPKRTHGTKLVVEVERALRMLGLAVFALPRRLSLLSLSVSDHLHNPQTIIEFPSSSVVVVTCGDGTANAHGRTTLRSGPYDSYLSWHRAIP